MSLESLRLLLEDTARVVEVADAIQSPPLRARLLGVIRDSIHQVSSDLSEVTAVQTPQPQPLPHSLPSASLPPPSLPPPSPIQPSNDSIRDVDARTIQSRGSSRYNVFIGQVTPLLRLQNPERHPKANMAIAAGLWRAYKHLNDDEMMEAVRQDIHQMDAPQAGFRSAGLRSLSIESE